MKTSNQTSEPRRNFRTRANAAGATSLAGSARRLLLPALLGLCLAGIGDAHAAVRTWTGGGADNNWNTAGNWDTGAPVNNDSVVFSGSTRVTNFNNISGLNLTGLGFNGSGFLLGGSAITNTGGVMDNFGNNTNAIMLHLGVAQAFTNVPASTTLVFSGNITNYGFGLSIGGDGNVFLNGVLGGTTGASLGSGGSLTHNGTGTLRLGAANNFAGGLTINSGTVQLANGSAIPSGAGRGDVTINGVATLNLNGNNSTINGLYGSGLVDNLAGTGLYTLTVGNNSTNSAGNFTGTIQNTSGSIGLNKVTTNVFTLNGYAGHSGPTTVSAGTLALGSGGSLPMTASITVNPGALLDVSAVPGGFLLGSQTLTAGRTTNDGPSDIVGTFTCSSGTINPYRPAVPGTLTFGNGLSLTGGKVNFDLGNTTTIGGGVNDLIVVNGALNLSGVTTIGLNPVAGSFAAGSYTLITNTAGPVNGSGGNLAANLPRGLAASFDTTTTPNSVLLTMTGTATPANLLWLGNNTPDWDVQLTQNWLRGSAADVFYDLDNVTFSDAATNFAVNLPGAVSPGSTLFINSVSNYTIGGVGAISGTGTLTVNGGGTVTLNTPNNYTGDTIVNNGSRLILGVLSAPPHITVYNGVALGNLHLGGGGVFLSDNANDTYRANFNNLIVDAGAGSLAMRNRQSSSSYIFQFNSVSRSVGGTVDFNNIQSKASSPQVGLLITNTTTVNGILGGFATIYENDWIVPVATGAGSTAYNGYQTNNANPAAWGAVSNVVVTATPGAALNNTVINSLKLPLAATVTINSGQSLTLSSGGLLVPGNAGGAATITGGTLMGGAAADLIVHEHSALQALTIGSVIADNGGASALTKSGQGTLILTGANTYSGPTYINGPSISAGNNNTPGLFAAGTLQLGSGGTSGSIDASSGVINNGNLAFGRSDPITFALPISGQGGLKVLAGNVTLTGNNSYAGATTISSGTLQVGNGGTSGSLGSSVSIANNGSLIFNRSDAVSYAKVISGLGSLTQQGSGILTLSGANTYSGNTAVGQGRLALGAGGSLSNSAAIIVSTGAVLDVTAAGGITLNGAVSQSLGGSGTVAGDVRTTDGSSLKPAGAGVIGTLTLNNSLSLEGGTFQFDISAGSQDQIAVGGSLTLNAGLLQLNVIGAALPNGTYRLFAYSGTLGGAAANLAIAGFSQPGQIASLSDATPGEIDLVVATYNALNLVWRGDGLNNNWDVNITADWMNGGVASVFHNSDLATFDDTGSNTPPVNLIGTVSPALVTVNAVQDYTFAGKGVLDGGASLVKNNTGNLILLTTNAWTGSTTINNGTVQVGNGTASGDIGTGPITDNASLVFNQPDSRELSANLGGTGNVVQQGAGTLTLLGDNSGFSGGITIATGALQVGAGAAAGTLGSGPVTNNTTLTITRSGNLTVNSAITGSGMIVVDGPGTVTMGGANTYLGNTYISNGIVKLGASQVIPDGGATTGWLILDGGASAAGTFDLNGFNETVNALSGLGGTALGQVVNNGSGTSTLTVNAIADTTFAGLIKNNLGAGGTVALVKDGASMLTLTPGGSGNTFSGGTTISNGVVSGGTSTVANGIMLGAGPVTFYGGALRLAGFSGSTSPDYGTFGNAVIVAPNASATVYGTCRGGGFAPSSATGSASSTLTFVTRYVRGNFGGNWTAFNGLLIVSNTTASANTDFRLNTALGFPNARVKLATGEIGGAYMYNLVSGTPTIPIGELTGDASATIALNSGSASGQPARWSVGGLNTSAQYDGGITDSHGIIKVGTGSWTLTSANLTYTGPTTVSNGVLVFNATAVLPPSSTYTIAAPGTLDVSAQGTLTVANTIQGNGTLLGGLAVNGTVMPGFASGPGVLTVNNAASLNGTTLINLNRTNTLNSGRLAAASIACGGVLTVTNIGPTLASGDSFQLFSGPLSGAFTATNLPPLANGLSWVTANLAVNGTISIVGQIILPSIGGVEVTGTTNVIAGTGGTAGATYYLLSSTNVGLPLAQWTPLATNTFAADGSFSVTNTSATNALQFYKVQELLP